MDKQKAHSVSQSDTTKEQVNQADPVQPTSAPANATAGKPVDEVTAVLTQERDDFKNKYLRALADYQNLDRRMRDERVEIRKSAEANVILELLPFLDVLNQAELFIKDQGLKMVKDKFVQQLADMGVKTMDLVNKEYDPYTAEAIEVVEGEKENMVVEIVRNGYMLYDKILRPAQVKVSKKSL